MILVALNDIVNRDTNFHSQHDFASSEKYSRRECQFPVLMGKSSPTVDGILLVLKAMADRNLNSHFWQDFGSSESLTQW